MARPKETQRKIFYNVRLDKQPLGLLKMISKVEGETTSCLIRRSILFYVSEWHRHKKGEIQEREQDFNEVRNQLNGWSSNHFDLGL